MNGGNNSPKTAHIQMAFLGFVSLAIGVLCMLDTTIVYKLSPLTSISESATTGNMTGMLLPFALGCMFTYAIAYAGYTRFERVIVRIMGVGFAAVALQICKSPYIEYERVGLLGLSPEVSNIIHSVGAVVGFGLMFVWIAFFFTRTNPDTIPTKRKLLRNKIYTLCAGAMASGLALFAVGQMIDMGRYIVFIAEEFILIPAGIAVIVKSGLILADKEE